MPEFKTKTEYFSIKIKNSPSLKNFFRSIFLSIIIIEENLGYYIGRYFLIGRVFKLFYFKAF
jgi:hypothetical protein